MATSTTTVEIASITYAEGDPFPALVVTGLVTQGARSGEDVSCSLTLSPKAVPQLKRFLAAFDLGHVSDLAVDEDTGALEEPDLVGATMASEGPELPWPFASAPE